MVAFWTVLSVATGASVALITAVPHMLLKQSRSWYSLKNRQGQDKLLPDETKASIDSVLEKLELPLEREAKLSFFYCRGMEALFFGYLDSRMGAFIGLPGSLSNRKSVMEDLVDQQGLLSQSPFRRLVTLPAWSSKSCKNSSETELQLDNHGIDDHGNKVPASDSKESLASVALIDALTLSEKAERFLIARQIFLSDTGYMYRTVFTSLIVSTIAVVAADFLHSREQRLKRPIPKQGAVCLLMYLTSVMAIRNVFEWSRHNSDRDSDKKACLMGKEYAEGALEYYSKEMERNVALRALGYIPHKVAYTPTGDHSRRTLYIQSLSPSVRRKAAVAMLENYAAEENQMVSQ